jgi:hypothetical protein
VPTRVKVYTYAPAAGAIPLAELDWTMYELPSAGDRYWHDRDTFAVREVDESQDPPQVHLVHDHEWSDQIRDQLPEGYDIDGGRDSNDGRWHFMATTPPHGRPLGPVVADDLEDALGRAIANAAEHYRRSQEAPN